MRVVPRIQLRPQSRQWGGSLHDQIKIEHRVELTAVPNPVIHGFPRRCLAMRLTKLWEL
jgi:predicted metal-dependent hydrolase